MKHTTNIFDYVAWRGDLSFHQVELNEIDCLIFSRLSYIPFEDIIPNPGEGFPITLAHAARIFFKTKAKNVTFGTLGLCKNDLDLFMVIAKSPRYRNLRVHRYVNVVNIEDIKQFSALTISLDNGIHYVAYRGTDDSVIGWKENFMMSFKAPVPSQLEAVAYLEATVNTLPGKYIIGGHSKGGNLAIYAAAFCERRIQNQLVKVYNLDGPGFLNDIISTKNYQAIKRRIYSYLPQDSVIGMLLEHGNLHTFVHSTQKGLLQHDLYTWEIDRNGFTIEKEISPDGLLFNKVFKEWLDGLDEDLKEQLVEVMFELVATTKIASINELLTNWIKYSGIMLQSLKKYDEPTRKMISETLNSFVLATKNNLPSLFEKSKSKPDKLSLLKPKS